MISAEILFAILLICFGISLLIGYILVQTKFKNSKTEKQLCIIFAVPLLIFFLILVLVAFWACVPCEITIENHTPEVFNVDENAIQLQWEDGVLVGAQMYKNVNDIVVIVNYSNVVIRGDIDGLTALIVNTRERAHTIFGVFDCYHYTETWVELV